MRTSVLALTLGLTLALAAPVAASTFSVNTTADTVDNNPGDGLCADIDGACSLRAAVMESNSFSGPDVIELLANPYVLSLTGFDEDGAETGDLDVLEGVTILGAGPTATIIDGFDDDRVFHIITTDAVVIEGVRIQKGLADDTFSAGAGIFNQAGELTLRNVVIADNGASDGGGGIATEDGVVVLEDTAISGNGAQFGGGIAISSGSLSLQRTTVDGNQAGCGGGIILGDGDVTITNSTIAHNSVFCQGGGLLDEQEGSSTFTIVNSTLAYNLPENYNGFTNELQMRGSLMVALPTYDNCDLIDNGGNFDAGGNFLAGAGCGPLVDTPQAALLAPWTVTANGLGFYRPLAGNPVIDGVNMALCEADDQRGTVRPQGAACDAGAIEIVPVQVSGVPPPGSWNVAYIYAATSSSEGPVTFTLSGGILPPGLGLSAAGIISGTPTTIGVYAFSITATDGFGQFGSQATSISITGAPLAVTASQPPAGTVGSTYTFAFSATGSGAVTYSLQSGTPPPGLGLSAAGQLAGMPTTVGPFGFTVHVQDQAGQQANLLVSVTINPELTLSGTPPLAHQGQAYSFAFTASGAGTVTFAVSAGSTPPGLTVSPAGVLSGTPTAAGVFPFTMHAADAASQVKTLDVSVTVDGRPVIAGLTNVTIPQNGIATLPFTISDDLTPAASLTVSATSDNQGLLPNANVVITGAAGSRTLTLTPLPGLSGQANVTVVLNDGTLTTTASLLLTVTAADVPDPPTGLTVTVSGLQATFTWTPPATGTAATFYVLELGSVSGGAGVAVVDTRAPVTTWTLAMAPNGYYARVRGGNGYGIGDVSNEVPFAVNDARAVPGPPRGLVATVGAAGLVSIAWAPPVVGGAPTSWQVQVGTSRGASDIGTFDLPLNPRSASGALPAGEYFIRMRGRNAFGLGAVANEVQIRVGSPACTAVPDAPVLLTPMVIGWTATLTWTPPVNAPVTGYRVLAGSAPGQANLATFDVSAASAFFGQAAPGTYYVRVQAVNACGLGAPSNSITVVLGPSQNPPPAPTNVRTQVTGHSVRILWDSVEGAGSHIVEGGSAPGATGAAIFAVGQNEIVVDNVASGIYYVRVRAVGAVGASAPSAEVVVVVP